MDMPKWTLITIIMLNTTNPRYTDAREEEKQHLKRAHSVMGASNLISRQLLLLQCQYV